MVIFGVKTGDVFCIPCEVFNISGDVFAFLVKCVVFLMASFVFQVMSIVFLMVSFVFLVISLLPRLKPERGSQPPSDVRAPSARISGSDFLFSSKPFPKS